MSLPIVTVQELKARLDSGESPLVIDVREAWEYEQYNIGAELIPLGSLPLKIDELKDFKETEIILHCKSGVRSANAQAYLLQNGFKNVKNLAGGILDWQRNFG